MPLEPVDFDEESAPIITTRRASRTPDVAVQHAKHNTDAVAIKKTEPLQKKKSWFVVHAGELIIGMAVSALLAWFCMTTVLPFFQNTSDQWHTGDGRLSYYQLNVGHNGTSDFITQYYNGHVVVIEFPGGDPQKAHIFSSKVALNNVNGNPTVNLYIDPQSNHQKPDVLVFVEGFSASVMRLHNTGDSFVQEA
jgi:hypothetical protein